MAPEFCDGHIVVVDPGGVIKNDCYVIVQTTGETVLRQLRIRDGKYYLLCNSVEQVEVNTDLHNIIGVVSQRSGRRRKDRKHYDI